MTPRLGCQPKQPAPAIRVPGYRACDGCGCQVKEEAPSCVVCDMRRDCAHSNNMQEKLVLLYKERAELQAQIDLLTGRTS